VSQLWNETCSQILPSFPLNHPLTSVKATHSTSSIEVPDRKEKRKTITSIILQNPPYHPFPPFPSALYNTLPTNVQTFPKCETHNNNNNNNNSPSIPLIVILWPRLRTQLIPIIKLLRLSRTLISQRPHSHGSSSAGAGRRRLRLRLRL
jgi:hypothetical protein